MKNQLDLSKITDHLYIAASPTKIHREDILGLNVKLIINMVLQRKHDKELDMDPLRVIWIKAIDFPLTPLPVKAMIKAANEAITEINSGNGVLVYCRKGIHRSAAMATAILIAQGYETDQAIKIVKSKRDKAKPDTWYIKRQLIKFEREWNKLSNEKIEN